MKQYTLIRRRNQKYIRMHFRDSGELVVSAPYGAPGSEIESFIEKNSSWIEKNSKKIPSHSYSTGDNIVFWGSTRQLFVIKGKPESVDVLPDSMLLTVTNPEDTDRIKKMLYEFYGKNLYVYLNGIIKQWCEKLETNVPQLMICNSKTRWGVCYSSRKLIKISAMTACLAQDLIELILVHELCHLKQCNHGPAFHLLMQSVLPNAKELEKKLKSIDRQGLHRNLF